MYPSIELFGYTVYFQWLGIIFASLAFIYAIYHYCKKINLRFPYFFSFLSFFIIVPYFLWRYVYDFIEYKFYFPIDILNLLSPYNYRFSFIWVSLWIFVMIFLYILSLQYKQERRKWIDTFFFSIVISMVVIWPFLLLWDNFYWKITNSIFGIMPLTQATQIPYSTKIWPVGIFVSILWIMLYLFWKILLLFTKKHGVTIYLLPLLFLGFAYIFTFQQYPKHFLFWIDIKIFYSFVMAFVSPVALYLLIKEEK